MHIWHVHFEALLRFVKGELGPRHKNMQKLVLVNLEGKWVIKPISCKAKISVLTLKWSTSGAKQAQVYTAIFTLGCLKNNVNSRSVPHLLFDPICTWGFWRLYMNLPSCQIQERNMQQNKPVLKSAHSYARMHNGLGCSIILIFTWAQLWTDQLIKNGQNCPPFWSFWSKFRSRFAAPHFHLQRHTFELGGIQGGRRRLGFRGGLEGSATGAALAHFGIQTGDPCCGHVLLAA